MMLKIQYNKKKKTKQTKNKSIINNVLKTVQTAIQRIPKEKGGGV